MHEALDISTNQLVAAATFSLLNPSTRAGQLPRLVCRLCRQPAYFIRRSTSGRAACFGSRPHLFGCNGRAPDSLDGGSAGHSDGDIRANFGHEFIVVFVRPTPIVNVVDDPDKPPRAGGAQHHVNDRGLIRSASNLLLRQLLQKLVDNPDYSQSEDRLRIDDLQTTVAEYCVKASDIDGDFNGETRLYWGTVVSSNTASGVTWLNLGRPGMPSVRLLPKQVDRLLADLEYTDATSLRGSSFVFHGPAELVKGNRMMLRPKTIERFAMLPPEAHPIA